jgi:chromate transporter
VERKGWLTREQFLDLLGATNLIPGPNSTEMAIHIGWKQARWAGLVVAGVSFILPATLLVLAIAWAYERFGTRPEAVLLLYGIKPVIIAIVVQALWKLGRQALKSRELVVIAALGITLTLGGLDELVVLFGAGLLAAAARWTRSRLRPGKESRALSACPLWAWSATIAGSAPAAPLSFGLLPRFFFFLKVGSVLFGGGYVLLAFLRADLVEHWGWLTDAQLLDAITVGQVTPGPLFTTATFIGYILGGLRGAVLATVGIFLPAFVFVAVSGPVVPRLRRSPTAGAFLDGVNAASLSLMAVVTGQLGHSALVDWLTVVLAILAGIALWRVPINSLWLILLGGLIGCFRMLI